MPIKETDLQTELKDACIKEGGFSYKMSNRFLVGVLDLYMQLPMLPTVILEVKYEKKPRKDGRVWVDLSPHQIRNINGMNAAGGVAGWVVLTRRGPGEYGWNIGRTPPTDYVEATPSGCASVKRRGHPWPIFNILTGVIQSC